MPAWPPRPQIDTGAHRRPSSLARYLTTRHALNARHGPFLPILEPIQEPTMPTPRTARPSLDDPTAARSPPERAGA